MFAQDMDKKQIKAARNFLHYVMSGEAEKCWQLFDKADIPGLTREQFITEITLMRQDLKVFDSFELVMKGAKLLDDKQVTVYTFKALSKTKNVVDDISIDLSFYPASILVAGIEPKKLQKENTASTSPGKETPIEKKFSAVIEGVTYNITGINIVHFAGNQGLLAIQVEFKIPAGADEWKKKEAVKFAKYLVQNGYVEKAKLKATEIGITLMNNIGVSFLDQSAGGGVNVMLQPADYN